MSVTTAPPFVNSAPATGGSSANASDSPASEDDSDAWAAAPWDAAAAASRCGFKIDRASLMLYSEKLELLLRPGGGDSKLESDEKRLDPDWREPIPMASATVFALRKAWPGGALMPELMAEAWALPLSGAAVLPLPLFA